MAAHRCPRALHLATATSLRIRLVAQSSATSFPWLDWAPLLEDASCKVCSLGLPGHTICASASVGCAGPGPDDHLGLGMIRARGRAFLGRTRVRQRLDRHSCRLHAAIRYALALFLLINALVLNGALWFFSPEGYKEVALQHSVAVLRGDGLDDSWGIMSEALDYAQTPHTTPLYS